MLEQSTEEIVRRQLTQVARWVVAIADPSVTAPTRLQQNPYCLSSAGKRNRAHGNDNGGIRFPASSDPEEDRPLSHGTPSRPLLGLPIARVIPQDVHTVIDYAGALALSVVSFLADSARERAVGTDYRAYRGRHLASIRELMSCA